MNILSEHGKENVRIVILSDDHDLDAGLQANLQRAGLPVTGFYDPADALAWEKLQDGFVTRIYLIDHIVGNVSWKEILKRFQQHDLVIDPVLLLPQDDPSSVHQAKRFGVHEVFSRKDHKMAMLPAVIDQLTCRIVAERQLQAVCGGLLCEELLKAKEMAELANQARSAFLTNVSHEIRNPLGAVIGMAKTLEKTDLDEEQQKYLRSIILSSDKLLLILNDMLDCSRRASGKLEGACTHFSIKEAVEELVNLCGRDAAFSIPKTWEPVLNVSDSDEGAYAAQRDSLKVLIAEDDAINQMYLAGFLRSQGWDVDTAYNGQKALEIFQHKRYDIVLMDGQMPRMDGFEATRKIRELEANKERKTPILAITGYAIPGDRERFFDAGMDDYLSKPIDENKLLDTIRALTTRGKKKADG